MCRRIYSFSSLTDFSGFVGASIDALAILSIGMLNAVIGFYPKRCYRYGSHHNEVLSRIRKTGFLSPGECLLLLAIGAIPSADLELVKLIRQKRARRPALTVLPS